MANVTDYKPLEYKGNGSTQDFPYTWKLIEVKELVVQLKTISSGDLQTLSLGSDYTVTANRTGGNVHLNTTPSAEYNVVISRNTTQYQTKGYSTSTGFQGSEIEKSFDQVSCNLQEMDYNISVFEKDTDKKIEEFEGKITEDFESLQRETDKKISTNKSDTDRQISELTQNVNQQLETNKSDTDRQISENKSDTDKQIQDLTKSVNKQITDNKTDTDKQIDTFKKEITGQFDELDERVTTTLTSDKADTDAQIEELTTSLNQQLADNKTELEGIVDAFKQDITGQFGTLTDTTNESIEGLEADIASFKEEVTGTVEANKTELESQVQAFTDDMTAKFDKVSDAAEKVEQLEDSVQLAQEVAEKAQEAANKLDVFQSTLDGKADITYVDSQDNALEEKKADKTVTDKLQKDYDDLNATLETMNVLVSQKADKSYTNEQLALKANKTDVNEQLELKADKTYVDSNLALKADKSEVIEQLNGVTQQVQTELEPKLQELEQQMGEMSTQAGAPDEVSITKTDEGKLAVKNLTKVVCITQSYKNGTSGYNVYSNGYCEQWGIYQADNASGHTTISLLKNYKDGGYQVVQGQSTLTTQNNSVQWFFIVADRQPGSFQLNYWQTVSLLQCHWRTCGYLAEGEY